MTPGEYLAGWLMLGLVSGFMTAVLHRSISNRGRG